MRSALRLGSRDGTRACPPYSLLPILCLHSRDATHPTKAST